MIGPPAFLRALRAPPRSGDGNDGVRVRRAGELVAPTGHLIACDGQIIEPAAALSTTLPPGRYPIFLGSVGGDHAWAMLVVSDKTVATWRPDKEADGVALGYAVDSGVGCFIDTSAAELHGRAEEALSAAIGEELSRRGVTATDPNAWHDAFEAVRVSLTKDEPPLHERVRSAGLDQQGSSSVVIDAETGANIVVFNSGAGDGVYATWVGFDDSGQVARLLTDFQILTDAEQDEAEQEDDIDVDDTLKPADVQRLFAMLASNGKIELGADVALDGLARGAARLLALGGGATALHAWLLDQVEVEEVFLSEEELEELLAAW